MEGLQWWCIHNLKLSLEREDEREDDEGRTTREARAKTGLGTRSHIYCEPGPQIDRREAHFRRRARGTKIGPSEDGRGVVKTKK
jgi:hypothetical protein